MDFPVYRYSVNPSLAQLFNDRKLETFMNDSNKKHELSSNGNFLVKII
jgi:hypothetical protein